MSSDLVKMNQKLSQLLKKQDVASAVRMLDEYKSNQQ